LTPTATIPAVQLSVLRIAGINAERDALFSLARSEVFSQESSRKLIRKLDLM
jgi:hypothetical protein